MFEERTRRDFLRLLAGIGASATVGFELSSCGSSVPGPTAGAKGRVRALFAWTGCSVPNESRSVKVMVLDALGKSQSAVITRASGKKQAIFEVLAGTAQLYACAYAAANASGQPLAQAATAVMVSEGQTSTVPLSLLPTELSPLPNILVILADDLGYADLGVQGCPDVPTPNLDSLARNGIRFTNGYASSPICGPTRAGFLTGRYQERFGFEQNPLVPPTANPQCGLPLSEVTIAERLQERGYTTAIVGKWHLGYDPVFHPQRRGFDEFFGFLEGGSPYLAEGEPLWLFRGTQRVAEYDYLTDAFAREASAFIMRHRHKPFFLYLSFNAVHTPMQATAKYLDRFSSIADAERRTFAAMLSALDDGVGQVLATLRQLGLEENTLVFFLSDNGGPTTRNTSRNHPLRGLKGQVYEGGIRVPFLAQWKGHLPEGRTYDQPVISLDIAATALAAAGWSHAAGGELDGVDLRPYLCGLVSDPPHGQLFWRFGAQWAMREGQWKMLQILGHPPALYNLTNDIGESTNLAQKHPERLKKLQAVYNNWNEQLPEPLW